MRYPRRLISAVWAVALLPVLAGCAGKPEKEMKEAAAAMREAEAAEADGYAPEEIRAARTELLQAKSALADEEASLFVLKGFDQAGNHFSKAGKLARGAAETARVNREAAFKEAEGLKQSVEETIRELEQRLMKKGVPVQPRVLITAAPEGGPLPTEGNVVFRGRPTSGGEFAVAVPPPSEGPMPVSRGARPAAAPPSEASETPPPTGGQKVVRFFRSGPDGPGGMMMPGGPPPKPAKLTPELEGLRTKMEMIHFSFSLGIDFLEKGQANGALKQFRETLAKCELLQDDLGSREETH